MDWQLLGISFLTVFMAELGDKSQIAAIALSGGSRSPRGVFCGSVVALLLASLLGAIAGEGAAQVLPASLLKAIAAIGFILMALTILWPHSEEGRRGEE